MEFFGFKLLALFLLFSLTCNALARKRNYSKKTMKHGKANHNDLSEEDKKLIELITSEGKPDWTKMAEEMAKEKGEEMKAAGEMEVRDRPVNLTALQADTEAPSALISSLETKLSRFVGPLSNRLQNSVSGLTSKWSGLSDDDRVGIAGTLGVITSNIEKFGKAGEDPVGALQATIDIIASIASNLGPKGQLISMGLGFVSALMGLFGKGTPKPKPMSQVVREQIDAALEKYQDQDLTSKAQGLITALSQSKAYLDGAAESGNPLTDLEMTLSASRVPITQGAEFMGQLASVILTMQTSNVASDAKKCIKYCELYATMTTIRDMILTQFISMSSNSENVQNDVNGLIGYRQNFRDGARVLFEKLLTIDYSSNIMPYFDPDVSTLTDKYSTALLNIGKYDRSKSGMYCIFGHTSGTTLVWENTKNDLKISGKPYTKYGKREKANCIWKLVPKGNNIYSIVNKKDCEKKDPYCDAMLSWGTVKEKPYVSIDHENPVLWEIQGSQWVNIRSKKGCPSNKWCGKDLKVMRRTIQFQVIRPPKLIKQHYDVGQLAQPDGKNYWLLQKKPN